MRCPNCQNKVKKTDPLCPVCGQSLLSAPKDAEAASASAYTPAEDASGVVWEEDTPFYQPKFEKPAKEKGKKRPIGKIVALAAAVLALVGGLLIALNYKTIYGSLLRTFGSDASYYSYVEAKDLKKVTDSISSYYDAAQRTNGSGDFYTETTLSFTMGDQLRTLLQQQLGSDLSFLNDISLQFTANHWNDIALYDLGLYLSGTQILTAEEYLDFTDKETYLSFPMISDKSLYRNSVLDIGSLSSLVMMPGDAAALQEVLPEEKDQIVALVKKYIDVALNNIKNVSMKEETLTLSGISQDCHVITVTITEADRDALCEALYRELKSDAEIRKLILAYEDKVKALDYYDGEIDYYGDLLEELDSELREIDERRGRVDSTIPLVTLTAYVSDDHKVVGRKLEAKGDVLFDYAKVTDGKQFALRADIGKYVVGECLIEGKGSENGSKKSGSFTLTQIDNAETREICDITLTDFDLDGLKNGKLNGSVRVTPSREMLAAMVADSPQLAMLFSINMPAVEIKCESESDRAKIDISLQMGSTLLLGASIDRVTSAGKAVQPPMTDTVDLNDPQQIQDFLESMQFDDVTGALRHAGLPEDLVSAAEAILSQIRLKLQYYFGAPIWDDAYRPPIDDWDDDGWVVD